MPRQTETAIGQKIAEAHLDAKQMERWSILGDDDTDKEETMDERINEAVDEVAAAIASTQHVTWQAIRAIEREIRDAQQRLEEPGDRECHAFFVIGMYEGVLKDIVFNLQLLHKTAEKAQAAVKYLGAQNER